jgi:serine/threonine protein kinase
VGPESILSAAVVDFGVAVRKAEGTDSGLGFGTLGYMALEQARGELLVDEKADVYALAGVVFTALTSDGFFESIADSNAHMLAHATREPLASVREASGLDGPLLELLREATRLEPERRPDVLTFERRLAEL